MTIATDIQTAAESAIAPITVTELITLLTGCDQSKFVRLGLADFAPIDMLKSYRGFYEQLAVGYSQNNDAELTVGEFKTALEAIIGEMVTGYKGGEYEILGTTPVWIDNTGQAFGNGVISICEGDDQVTLITIKF